MNPDVRDQLTQTILQLVPDCKYVLLTWPAKGGHGHIVTNVPPDDLQPCLQEAVDTMEYRGEQEVVVPSIQ